MGLKALVIKSYNAVVEFIDNSTKDGKVIDYGKGNTLPNDLIKKIDDSGTATQCIEKRISCINADGFNNEEFAKKVINLRQQKADDVLADLVPDVALYEGGVLKILYSNDGKKVSVEHVPFELVRKKKGGGFVFNQNFGTKQYKRNEDVHYQEWEPNLTPEQRAAKISKEKEGGKKQRGTLLYFFIARPGKRVYPVPSYYSALEDIESDAGLQKIERSNILDGFKADAIFKVVEPEEGLTKDNKEKTSEDSLDDSIAEFQEPGGRRVLILSSNVKEGMAEVVIPDTAPIYDAIDKATDRVPRRVCRNMNVPPVLIGMDAASILGNQQALGNSVKLFNANMLPLQALITEQFQKLFPDEKDCTISTSTIFTYIDPMILHDLTKDERRGLVGLAPIETTPAQNMGMAMMSSYLKILKDSKLSDFQKEQSLIQLFRFTPDNAKLMVYGNAN